MDSEQSNSDGQVEINDDDEVPPQYRVDARKSAPGRTRGSVPMATGGPQQKTRSTQSTSLFLILKQVKMLMKLGPQAAPANESFWIVRTIQKALSPASKQSSSKTKNELKQKENVETMVGIQEPQEQHGNLDQTQIIQRQRIELEHEFQDLWQAKEREWMVREQNQQRHFHQAQQYAAEREHKLQTTIRNIQLEKANLEAQHHAFIRQQQEASFKQMESARWLPEDETKVTSDLDMLKKDMRGWAKTNSIKDISILKSLGDEESAALMEQFANVVVLENGQLPDALTTTGKSPILLLNALLTDNVYMNFFRSPFFFPTRLQELSPNNSQPQGVLEEIYHLANTGKLILACQTASL